MSIHESAQELKEKLDSQMSATVSVALFGQPGAGKSTLINKIIGKKLAESGVETDKTVDAASYQYNGLRFVDLPGYGTKNFPKDSYFNKFKIEEFDLFLCVTSGKLHQADTEFFQELIRKGKVCVFVVNKHDELWEDGVSLVELERRKIEDIRKHIQKDVKIIFTSCRQGTGIDMLNEEIAFNLEDAKRERWVKGAKAYSKHFLDEKRAACEKYVTYAAMASAANGINPLPGVDVGVDVGIIVKLFQEIRTSYGLTDEYLDSLKSSTIPIVGKLANNLIANAAKEGVLILLKRMAGKTAVKTLSKYIPVVGQAVAAGLGYAITSNVGSSYLDDCHDLALLALNKKLEI